MRIRGDDPFVDAFNPDKPAVKQDGDPAWTAGQRNHWPTVIAKTL
jgi:hypothetical protein